ncbi:hypothetical protein BT69DRAFT_1346848 [Atractiella rhizophila]|nr:hypothetical protein BT69DRAFT_1346848 [Atractiella rhizophila]
MDSAEQKEALFALLDEYFASRPHLFSPSAPSPEATKSAANAFVSLASSNPSLVSKAIHSHNPNDPHAGKKAEVANKALGFAARNPSIVNKVVDGARSLPPKAPAQAAETPSPSLPPQTSSYNRPSAAVSPPAAPTPAAPTPPVAKSRFTPSGLTTTKSIGSLETTSGRAAFGSLFKKDPVPPKSYVTTAPSDTPLPPPPVRRGTSTPSAAAGKKVVTALYDYDSGADEDLVFKEGDKITVTEEVTADWWKGQVEGGKEGLFPTNYVQG